MKTVGLVIAHQDFQDKEYSGTKEMLESSNQVKVITISNQTGTATSQDNKLTTPVDLSLDQVETSKLDGLFFIGGPGALDWLDNQKSYELLKQMQLLKKPYGAICIAPRILAQAGVLKHKKATGWNKDDKLGEIFTKYDVIYQRDQFVVTDDHVVTATGPEVAMEFGREILCVLNILPCQLSDA